ncbi:MAG TPA: hypothetical protein VFS08_20080 [Gemmatimonadaceae bacterium]|nr:hypothetical protein [Gemmatimonadaceae bacterium]
MSLRSSGRVRMLAAIASLALGSVPTALVAQLPLPTTNDPRVGLGAGLTDAEVAAKNLRLVSNSPKPDIYMPRDSAGNLDLGGLTYANSDLAFRGNYVFQGNFSGFQIWDVSDPRKPVRKVAYLCATGQGDPSIHGNLLFISAEGPGNRIDCGTQGVQDTVSEERFRGVRIFDVSDVANPKPVGWIQSCRGSHTHTLVPDPRDSSVIYVYISGSAGIRSGQELEGCLDVPPDSAGSSRGRIDVARVPLDNPAEARVVNGARIFPAQPRPASHGAAPGDTTQRRRPAAAGAPRERPGPDQCHDITVYPAIDRAGGACGGYGILLDISDPVNPRRIDFAADTNFAFWHSATFSNDGSKVVFTDEWGGGTQPRCRVTDPLPWGADAIFTIADNQLTQHAYYKLPAAQTPQENCVAHNGSLIPIPGRDVMAQGWYQGGVSVMDFTDPNHPVEIAYFDRGPVDSTRMYIAGSWGAYWYNGYIYSSAIARGLDILELTPSEFLTQNEIDAARSVVLAEFNPQSQPRFVWPATFSLSRAYLDQLERGQGLAADRIAQARRDLDAAERLSGAQRQQALTRLASTLEPLAANAADAARVRLLVQSVRDLAAAR